jgi:hypothetical protein
MRIALAPAAATGLRSGRVLLADQRVTALGALRADVHSQDARVESIESLGGWDLLVSDAPIDDDRVIDAARAGIPLVTPFNLDDLHTDQPAVVSASRESGIPAALAVLAMDRLDTVASVTAAITVPAKGIRRGRTAVFPEPISARWSETVPSPVATPEGLVFLHAPYDGPLTGISVRASGDLDGRRCTVVHGVVDDPLFLGAIALAAAGLMLLDGDPIEGPTEVQTRAAAYLAACRTAGLAVASFNAAS